MIKHTQTICRQQPTKCLSVFDHLVGLALKGLKQKSIRLSISSTLLHYYPISISPPKAILNLQKCVLDLKGFFLAIFNYQKIVVKNLTPWKQDVN